MYHTISSDDDDLPELGSKDDNLPAAGSLYGRRVQSGNHSAQTKPIVLSDSDSDCSLTLGARLKMKNNNEKAALKRPVTSTLPNLYSSNTDSDQLMSAEFRPLSEGWHGMSVSGRGPVGVSSSVDLPVGIGAGALPVAGGSPATKRRKRTPEEIAENKRQAEMKKILKEEEKERKRLEREDKAKAKEAEMAKKRFLRETKRAATPGECLKHLMLMVDPELVKQACGARIIAMAAEREQRYEIQPQAHANLISFWREVSEACDVPGQQFEVVKKEVVEDQLLLWLPVTEFLEYVYAQRQQLQGSTFEHGLSLRSFIQGLQKKLENRSITLIVQGLQQYYKEQMRGRGKKQQQIVSRLDVEETLVDIQFTTRCNIRFTEDDNETAKLVWHYTKAVAETPYKKDRNISAMNIHIDNATRVKLEADGRGITSAWRQIIQIFRGIGAEVANAIMAEYPTPRTLYESSANVLFYPRNKPRVTVDNIGSVGPYCKPEVGQSMDYHWTSEVRSHTTNVVLQHRGLLPRLKLQSSFNCTQAYQTCSTEKEAVQLLENILVRRGYGVMETSRRVGKELSKKLHTLLTSTDPEQTLK